MKLSFKILRRFNVFAAGGLSALYFFDNAYNLENVKNKLEYKINNAAAEVRPKINYLVNNVMNDMSLTTEERSLIQTFIVNDFDIKHLGYPAKNYGAFLGIPQTFVLDKWIDFNIIPTVNDTDFPLDSPEANMIKDQLTLSTEAKKFAIASELFEAKHVCFYYLGFLPLYVFLQGNGISILSEKILKNLNKPLPFFHAFVFLMTVWLYILLQDLLNIYRQIDSTLLAGKLGPSYVDGGIEYYKKILERNKIFKKLNKDAPYTDEGERQKYLGFRTVSVPYERKIKLLNDLKKSSRPSNENNALKYVL